METPESMAAHSAPSPGRIGRPRAWTASRCRQLARLYLGTALPVESIIKVVMPDDDVKVNSAQKTMHDMLGNDPRPLRPGTREDMNQRFKWFRRSFDRGRPPEGSTLVDSITTRSDATGDQSGATLTGRDEPFPDDLKGPTGVAPDGTHIMSSAYSNFSPESMTFSHDTLQAGSADHAASPGRLSWAVPSQPRRQNTVFSHLTNMSTDSVRLVKRLSTVSTIYAKQVTVLLRKLSLGNTCNAPCSSSTADNPVDLVLEPDNIDGPDGPVLVPPPGIALPGDFLCRHWYCALYCIGEQDIRHPQACWCSIANDAELATNSHSAFGWQPAAVYQGSDPTPDHFGNTLLHVLAASQGQQRQLFTLLRQSSDIGATNSAGQTFLHVLAPDWFTSQSSASGTVDAAPVVQLLAYLKSAAPHLAYVRDVYGRTFFHRLHQIVGETHYLEAMMNVGAIAGVVRERDAFGLDPFLHPSRSVWPQHMLPRHTMTLSTLIESDQDRMIRHHGELLRVVTNAEHDPFLEDSHGRNALHCLAEVDFSLDCEQSSNNLGNQRRRGRAPAGAETDMARRLRYLEGLLRVVHADAINHYDRGGDTALMAFVIHLRDDAADPKSISLRKIFDLLLAELLPRSSGGAATIDARNRRGETALLVAARLGRRTALTRLLHHGANPYARDARGRGVLEILGETGGEVGATDVNYYGRLLACGGAVFGNKADKANGKFPDAPTRCDEWAVRRR